MTSIKINANIDKAKRDLKSKKNQIPFAMSRTINDLAFNAKGDIDVQIKTKLSRPTRYTQRAIEVKKSSKRKLIATVKVRDKQKQSTKLEHLFSGGIRTGKGLEGKLKGLGVLPGGMYIVPGSEAPLDSFGNIKKSFLNNLIKYFQTFKTSRGNTSSLEPGVWMRKFSRAEKKRRKKVGKSGRFEFFVVHKQVDKAQSGRRNQDRQKPEPVLLFINRPKYRRVFNMPETTKQIIIRDLEREFNKNYQNAIRTAKPV